jgi:uncharacterized membrane protein
LPWNRPDGFAQAAKAQIAKKGVSQMIKVEASIVINRPIEEVFAFLSDMENNLKWRSSQIEVKKTSEGPIGVGTTYRMVNNVLGRRIETEAEVIEYKPNRKFTSKDNSGNFPLVAQRIFEPVEGGTQVRGVLEAEPVGFFKLAGPLLESMAKRRVQADLANLKGMMEAHAL